MKTARYNLEWPANRESVPALTLSIHIADDASDINHDSWRNTEKTRTS